MDMLEEYGCEIFEREFLQDGVALTNEIGDLIENCDMLLLNGDVAWLITELKWSVGNVKCMKMNSGEEAFFFTLMDRKSGINKIVFCLPQSLNNAYVALRLLIMPSLKMMVGAIPKLNKSKAQLGKSLSLKADTGNIHNVYSDADNKGNVSARATQSSQNNIRTQTQNSLPNTSNPNNHFMERAIFNELHISQLNSTEFIPSIHGSSSQNMNMNKLQKFFSVGIISLGESARKNLLMVTPMINHLLSREVLWTFKNLSINDHQLLSILNNWTIGKSAKDFIFTFGGMAHREDMYVFKTTQSLVNPELPLLFEKMIYGLNARVKNVCFYRGTIGICSRSLIVNLPGKVDAAKHCLQKLQDYIENIIDALEK